MSAEENKATFMRFAGELGRGNLAIVDEVCSPNFAFHSPNWPDWPRGLEGARALAKLSSTLFSDIDGKMEDIFAEGDKVVVRWTAGGTYIGEARPGTPNPGDRFSLGGMSMYRFVDGKIAEDWGVEVFGPVGKPWG